MGEFADDALDREIDEWIGEFRTPLSPEDELRRDNGDHPYYVKIPNPKAGNKCDRLGCKGILVERTNSATGTKFLGCGAFPKCKRSYTIGFWKNLGRK